MPAIGGDDPRRGDALIADREVEPVVRPDQDAMDAVVMVDAFKSREELARRAVRLAVAVLVLEDENVGRLADVNRAADSVQVRQDGDAERDLA